MERWNSSDTQNELKEVKTFNPSVKTFESIQSDMYKCVDSHSPNYLTPVIVTRVEYHHYYHQYIYKYIPQREVRCYKQRRDFAQKYKFIDGPELK